jgi:hypothetical protein
MTADKTRKLVANFLKELSSKTNPSLLVFLCIWFVLLSEETARALMFMREFKYVTDPELTNSYKEAKAGRKAWFEESGWEFTPNVEPDMLSLLSYDSVADIHGVMEQNEAKNDAFVAFMSTPAGPLRTAEYGKMICEALLGVFGSRTTFSIIEKYESVQISVNGSAKIPVDVISFVGATNKLSFPKLEFDSAVQKAAEPAVHDTVAELAKNGWKQP